MVKSINIITDNDLCISCGACTHICPFLNIEMKYNSYREKWDASTKRTDPCLKCSGINNCLEVCPSYDMDYIKLASSNENNLLGKIKNVYNGFSMDNTNRLASSSGGFIRELCLSLMKAKVIDTVISIMHHKGLDYLPSPMKDVSLMPNSIYHNINYQNAFKILKKSDRKYLVIGLPCQITSIEKLLHLKKFSFLKERVYAKVALMCGYSFDRINALAFAYYSKVDINEISYREKGRYRKTRITNEFESKVFDFFKPKSFSELINNRLLVDRFLVQNGCLYCVDHMGYCADIVAGDAWQRRYKDDYIGTNILISRTAKGEEAISKINNFHIEKGFKNEIIESQSILYALGSIGEGMRDIKFKGKYFYPHHKRTINSKDIKAFKLGIFDLLKIKVIKKLFRERRFALAKICFAIIESKSLIKYRIKNYIRRVSLK